MLPIILSASQLPFDVGLIDVTALSVKIGAVSALLVLPAAASISFLFRLRDIELTGSETRQRSDCSGGESQHGSPEKVWFLLSMVVFLLFPPAWFEVLNSDASFSAKLQGYFENMFPCSLPFFPTDVPSVIDSSPHHHHSWIQLWPHESRRKKYPLTPQAYPLYINVLLFFIPI